VLLNPARPNTYASVRTHRSATMAMPGNGVATLVQSIDATPYRSRRIRLRAQVRASVTGAGNQAQMWLRVDRESGRPGFFDNMHDRPVTAAAWREYEISGTVADDASRITFGALVSGTGTFEFDDFELAAADGQGGWTGIDIADPGFERGDSALLRHDAGTVVRPGTPNRWVATSPGYEYTAPPGDAAEGRRAARIRQMMNTIAAPLFDSVPAGGSVIDEEIGVGLAVRVPLSLFADAVGTLPAADATALASLDSALDRIDLGSVTADDEDVRLADIVIAWNVFEHFYPYFDVVDVDWKAELDVALESALADRTGKAFLRTLRRLVARLGDGHGRVFHSIYVPSGVLPWRLEWIEDHAVVTASTDTALQHGDVVVALDGEFIEDMVAAEEQMISGSPQWKRVRAMQEIGAGNPGTAVRITIDRAGRRLDVSVQRGPRTVIREFDRPMIDRIEDGIWYVDLDRAPWTDIQSVIDSLAAAKGVIFDLRGYPAGNHQVLQHLLTGPDTSSAWMRIPRRIRPDNTTPIGFRMVGWNLQPLEPHIGGRAAFITDGRAISYAESVMGLVDHYRLGEIVGQPTAGANGNVNPFNLPGGFSISWTGMRVVRHDGSQHHLIGIQPTVPVKRTIRAVRAGRDELLEAALRVVRNR